MKMLSFRQRQKTNKNFSSHPGISVIIPIYNVEKYLLRCIESVAEQTFSDFECILVDDASPDNCPLLCDEYVLNDKRFKVIHKKENEGSSLARKTGLGVALGDFVLFVDPDDWIEINTLEKMYNKTVTEDVDIVTCDFFYVKPDSTQYIHQGIYLNDKIANLKKILSGDGYHCIWNKLIKREIYSEIIFPMESCGEDFVIILQAIYFSKKIEFINESLYYYCFNSESITNNLDRKYKNLIESYNNFIIIVQFLKNKFDKEIICLEPELSDSINILKYQFIINKSFRDINKMFELYPYSNKFIFNKGLKLSILRKILFYAATKRIIFPCLIADLFVKLFKPRKII